MQTVKANYKLTHSERPFCKVQIQSSSVRQTHRTWSRRPMICSPQAGLTWRLNGWERFDDFDDRLEAGTSRYLILGHLGMIRMSAFKIWMDLTGSAMKSNTLLLYKRYNIVIAYSHPCWSKNKLQWHPVKTLAESLVWPPRHFAIYAPGAWVICVL